VKNSKFLIIFFLLIIIVVSGCEAPEKDNSVKISIKEKDSIKIGFSMDTLIVERWQRDRDIFVAKANELGAEVIVQNANNDDEAQRKQVVYLLDQNIDVLVIIPHDTNKASELVEIAKKKGVKVVSYDRLVRNANVDLYISFDNIKVGELMAKFLVNEVSEGNYIIINGSRSDYNSTMFNQGYKNVLDDYVTSDKIKIIDEFWTKNWLVENAFNYIEEKLKQERVDAIIAANDCLAGAAIEALSEKRLAGKVKVVGHDADLAGCQRVVEGIQLMTVYKPINIIAKKAAEMAVKLAKGEELKVNNFIDDGTYQVPYYKIEPISITKDNIKETIIKDGFHQEEDIYRHVNNE